MKRYQGEDRQAFKRIAVVANDAIGNFAVSTPLLQMLAAAVPGAQIDYFSGNRTQELCDASNLFTESVALHGTDPGEFAIEVSKKGMLSAYDWVINVERTAYSKVASSMLVKEGGYITGPSIGPGGRGDLPFGMDERAKLWEDQEWVSDRITSRYAYLQTGFIGEIFCRLAYLEGDVPRYAIPSAEPNIEVPDILVAMAASLPIKLWPFSKWWDVLDALKEDGLSVGLVGAPPQQQQQYWMGGGQEQELIERGLIKDLRGTMTLPEVTGALAKSKAVLTIDNGILHMAASTSTPIVGLFRHGIHRLWAPPFGNVTVLTPGEGKPVESIEVKSVLSALKTALQSH